jgi:HEAT repeat protein
MAKSTIPVETLIQQLHGSGWTTPCDAARLLGQSGNRLAVEALLDLLQDRRRTVCRRAIMALGGIKDTKALPALMLILLESKRVSSLEPLKELIDDPDEEVRVAAPWATSVLQKAMPFRI